MNRPETLPISVPEWSGESSPFSKGRMPKFYRPEDLKAMGVRKTLRTNFFEKVLVGLFWKLGRSVPYAFVTETGHTRSLDAGCLNFLHNKREPEIELECDGDGYIVAVRPLLKLVERYEPMRPKIMALVSDEIIRSDDSPRARTPAKGHTIPLATIEAALLQRGFKKSPGSHSKVSGMEHVQLRRPLYLKTPSSNLSEIPHPVVVHPNLDPTLFDIAGVFRDDRYYHNSNLREFPERMNRGRKPENYGIALDFESLEGLNTFLDRLMDVPYKKLAAYAESVSYAEPILFDDLDAAEEELAKASATERDALIKARLGQGQFRSSLVEYWHGCAVTTVTLPPMLRASHIKPWRSSDNRERLDKFNGLLLTPNLDQAFDTGLISFDYEGNVMVSAILDDDTARALGVDAWLKLKKIEKNHRPYLKWHHANVFKAG
jgi:putative restriction endonuclease